MFFETIYMKNLLEYFYLFPNECSSQTNSDSPEHVLESNHKKTSFLHIFSGRGRPRQRVFATRTHPQGSI